MLYALMIHTKIKSFTYSLKYIFYLNIIDISQPVISSCLTVILLINL